jgi:hypothetical protein
MITLRPCLFACLLLATFAPFANSRAKVQVAVEDDSEENSELEREKRSLSSLSHLVPVAAGAALLGAPVLAAKAALLGPPILAVKAAKLVGAGLIGAKVLKKVKKSRKKVAKARKRVVSKAATAPKAPRQKCHTVWEEKSSPKCHTTYDQVFNSLFFRP